jgi:hypothetical protein
MTKERKPPQRYAQIGSRNYIATRRGTGRHENGDTREQKRVKTDQRVGTDVKEYRIIRTGK